MSRPSRPFDLDQARRRAKESLAALRVTQPDARLADAQHALAREHGYRTWPDLVRDTERFDVVEPDAVPWSRVTRVTVVCFVGDAPDAPVALHRHDDGDRWVLPADGVVAGEDVWDDAVLRIPLQRLGFRRQGTHPFALDRGRRHVAFWVDGARYDGTRLPHRADVAWWTGPAAEAVALLEAQGDGALSRLVAAADEHRRTMTDERHAADLHRTLVGAYLGAATPQGGSGFGGTDAEWRDARGVLVDALVGLRPTSEPVTFLDHCCANGHLAISFVAWGAERGVRVEPHGVDVAAELVARARADHPDLADRFHVGDALTWVHPDGLRFDLVHMLYDVVPLRRWAALTRHLLDHVVAPAGRLLLSHYGETDPAEIARDLGLTVAGRTGVPLREGRPRGHTSVWVTR